MWSPRPLCAFGLILLAACLPQTGPIPTATPAPTPIALTIALPTDLLPAKPALQACAYAASVGIFLTETGPDFEDFASVDLTLTLGEPRDPAPFAYPLGWEQITLLTHPGNPVRELGPEEIRLLFSGALPTWEPLGGGDVATRLWVPLESSPVWLRFQGAVLGGAGLSPEAMLAPSPQAMLDAVQTDPGAVGLVPGAWVRGLPVGVPELSGLAADALRLPVLAATATAPSGLVRQFISCLQAGEGQTVLRARYAGWEAAAP